MLTCHDMGAASEMAGLRRMVEGMRHEMQCTEDELFALREERAQADMERAAAADEADSASAVLTAAKNRQADLVAAVDEVTALPICSWTCPHDLQQRSTQSRQLASGRRALQLHQMYQAGYACL